MKNNERLIQYLKSLQDGDDLSKNENHENTNRSDIKKLKKGFNFLGWNIKINLGRKSNNEPYKYGSSQSLSDSRFHPIFFCLNTSEVFLLVKALLNLEQSKLRDDLIIFILKQLSNEGFCILNKHFPELNSLDIESLELKNRQESDIYSPHYLTTLSLKKSRTLIIRTQNPVQTIEGKLLDSDNNKISIKQLNGEIIEIKQSQIVEITTKIIK